LWSRAAVSRTAISAIAPSCTATPTIFSILIGLVLLKVFFREQVFVVRGIHIRYMQEPVPSDSKIHERGLDTGLNVDDSAFIDVPDVALLAGSLDVEFLQHSILDNRNAAFLRLEDID
jgi:hypothetical protein